jgi:integrase
VQVFNTNVGYDRRMTTVGDASRSTVITTVDAQNPLPIGKKRRGRRGNGEGCVAQRPDGTWYGYVSQEQGRRKWYTGKTRAEVAAKVARGVRATEDGIPIPPERGTVGQFLNEWLVGTVKIRVRPATYSSYRDLVRLHIEPELGSTKLSKLTPAEVQDMLNRKLASGLSPRRVDYIRAVLRQGLNQALRWGMVSRNVAALASSPRIPLREVQPLTPEQARILLDTASGDRLEALYSVALALGMRQGEILGLCWRDIDFEKRVIAVRHSLQWGDDGFQLVEPKSERSRRRLGPLTGELIAALRAHKARQNAEKLASTSWDEWGLVFTSTKGRPLHSSDVTHALQAHLAAAGLPRKRFHDLRHTCASFLLAQGVSPRVVMEILGHSQIALTLNTYGHVLPGLQADALERLHGLLQQPS